MTVKIIVKFSSYSTEESAIITRTAQFFCALTSVWLIVITVIDTY